MAWGNIKMFEEGMLKHRLAAFSGGVRVVGGLALVFVLVGIGHFDLAEDVLILFPTTKENTFSAMSFVSGCEGDGGGEGEGEREREGGGGGGGGEREVSSPKFFVGLEFGLGPKFSSPTPPPKPQPSSPEESLSLSSGAGSKWEVGVEEAVELSRPSYHDTHASSSFSSVELIFLSSISSTTFAANPRPSPSLKSLLPISLNPINTFCPTLRHSRRRVELRDDRAREERCGMRVVGIVEDGEEVGRVEDGEEEEVGGGRDEE